jgi:hypothetical protein
MQSPTADESRRLASDLQRAKQKLDEMQVSIGEFSRMNAVGIMGFAPTLSLESMY